MKRTSSVSEQENKAAVTRMHTQRHTTVPVQGDAAQVQYGRRGQQDVQRRPHQAEGLAVVPVLVDQLDGAERHDKHRHE